MIEAKVISDSVNKFDDRIVTLQLKYHRYIHAEVMTHRMFSRSASSSRAIPIKTIIAEVWNNPATPLHWGKNISGMQAKDELIGLKLILAKLIWKLSSKFACIFAYCLYGLGLHKQIGNRILEPFSFINVILTATEFDNFFMLRIHPDAQPEIQELATKMKKAIDSSSPTLLTQSEWHMPYITPKEKELYPESVLLKCSTARCARVSYSNHDGSEPDVVRDIELHERLVGSIPLHASPAEHQASPGYSSVFYDNFKGWVQYRRKVEELIYTIKK